MEMKKPENPSVCYRCKRCKACFITMREINRHLKKFNHYVTSETELNSAGSSAAAFPPLPIAAGEELDLTLMNSDSEDTTPNGENGGVDNNGNNRKSTRSVDGGSPQRSYADKVKKTKEEKAETETSGKKPNLTELNEVEDMETDTADAVTQPIIYPDDKLWPPVTTSTSDIDMMDTEPIFHSIPEQLNDKKDKRAGSAGNSPSKKKDVPAVAASSRTSSSGYESDKVIQNDPKQTGELTVAALNRVISEGSEIDKEPPAVVVGKIGTRKASSVVSSSTSSPRRKENGTNSNELKDTRPRRQSSAVESAPKGQPPPQASTKPEKKDKESLSLASIKERFNHMKWRDIPATAFTYSNPIPKNEQQQQQQGHDDQESKATPKSTTGKSRKPGKKNRYKCKYCDERFMYTVQIVSHVRRAHKSVSQTAPKKGDDKPKSSSVPVKSRKVSQDSSSTPAEASSKTAKDKPSSPSRSRKSSQDSVAEAGSPTYPLRSLYTRSRRSTAEVDYTIEKKAHRKPTKFTCKHCSQKFSILAYLKHHIHSKHPETVERLNGEVKTRKRRRFRFSLKRRQAQKPTPPIMPDSTTSPSNEEDITAEELPATLPNTIPEVVPATATANKASLEGTNNGGTPQSQRKGPTSFSCKHCSQKFPLLNKLKIHLHQVHPEMMKKAILKKIALNGENKTGIITDPPKPVSTRGQQPKSRLRSPPIKTEEAPPVQVQPIRRKSTKRLSSVSSAATTLNTTTKTQQDDGDEPEPQPVADIKPNLSELRQITLKKAGGVIEVITIENEPDGFVDTAESILAALNSVKSQTCPTCSKYFKFSGSLKNHLKVCLDSYLSDVVEYSEVENCQVEAQQMNHVKMEKENPEEEDEDEEETDVETSHENLEEMENDETVAAGPEDSSLNDSSGGLLPYYKQLDYCKCWLCDATVARFYNLKRHLLQVHKIKMTTNEIHEKQTQLLGAAPRKSKTDK